MSDEQQIWLVVIFAQIVVLGLLLLTRMQRMDAEPRPDLRDYFAAAVMQGWLAGLPNGCAIHDEAVARRCYAIADAMLKARQA